MKKILYGLVLAFIFSVSISTEAKKPKKPKKGSGGSVTYPLLECPASAIRTGTDQIWKNYRTANGLVQWSGAIPAPSSTTTLSRSSDGKLFLLSNTQYVALFSNQGSLLGLMDRRTGADFIYTPATGAQFSNWSICVGDTKTNEGCTAPNGLWLHGYSFPPACNIKKTARTSAGEDCENGTAVPILSFQWAGFSGNLEVAQNWELNETGLSVHSSLTGRPQQSNMGIVQFRSPVVTGLGRSPTAQNQLITPGNNGGLIHGPKQGNGGNYSSSGWPLQFFGYNKAENSIYVGAEDSLFYPKSLRATEVQASHPSSFSYIAYYPTDSGLPSATLPQEVYTVRLKPICSELGWVSLAHEYRSWLRSATSIVPLSSKRDLSTNLKDGVLWVVPYWTLAEGANGFLNVANKIKSYLPNTPLGFHLYNWYAPGFDLGNGKGPSAGYEPNGEGWPQAIASVEGKGSLVAPYINLNFADYTEPGNAAQQAACVKQIGKGCTSVHGAKSELTGSEMKNPIGSATQYPFGFWPFVANAGKIGSFLVQMCPFTRLWQEKMDVIWEKGYDLNSSGIYLDTFGSQSSGCWNPNHGHPVGYSKDFTDVDVEWVARTNRTGRFIAAERFAESHRSVIDVGFNYVGRTPSSVPVYQIALHDSQMLAGPSAQALDSDLAFRFKTAMSFVWGDQLGMYASSMFTVATDPRITYLSNLTLARRDLNSYLATGALVGPAKNGTTTASSRIAINTWCPSAYTCDKPLNANMVSVLGAYWRSASGADALIFSNVTDNTSTVNFYLPKYLRDRTFQVCDSKRARCGIFSPKLLPGGQEITLSVPALQVGAIFFN